MGQNRVSARRSPSGTRRGSQPSKEHGALVQSRPGGGLAPLCPALLSPPLWTSTKPLLCTKFPNLVSGGGGGGSESWGGAHKPAHDNIKYLKKNTCCCEHLIILVRHFI